MPDQSDITLEGDVLDGLEQSTESSVGSWEWDIETDQVVLSDEAIRIIGLDRDVALPSFSELLTTIHPDDLDRVRRRLDQALAGETSFYVDHRLVRPDGEILDVRVFGVVQRDAGGKARRVIGLAQNVTSTVRTQAALRASEHRVRSILNTAVDAIITVNERGIIETFNRAAEQIFGYSESEVIGVNVSVLMPSPYREEHDTYMRNYLETGEAKIIGIGREVKGRRKEGSLFPLELAVSEVTIEGRRIFTGVIKDVSDRRRLEKEILRISEQEQQRIGQDLHDGLGQMLTGIGLLSQH
ncbi:MAG TPA: PAS domain S-box protein, partial [Rhodothermia bacterium]